MDPLLLVLVLVSNPETGWKKAIPQHTPPLELLYMDGKKISRSRIREETYVTYYIT